VGVYRYCIRVGYEPTIPNQWAIGSVGVSMFFRRGTHSCGGNFVYLASTEKACPVSTISQGSTMNKSKAPAEIPAKAFELYDQYAHGAIDRSQFLSGLTSVAVGGLTAASLLGVLLPDYANAEQISFNDPDISAAYREFDSPDGHGKGRGYLVYPAALSEKIAVVLVVHENRGLNPYIEDVARRLAKAGFIAFAPDALFPVGGYPGNDDTGRSLQTSLAPEKVIADLKAAAKFAKAIDKGNGKLGIVGFCFGGAIANRLAVEMPDVIDAAVPFYGSPAAPEKLAQLKAPLQIHLGELDKRVNDEYPAYEAALKKQNADFEIFIYMNANHGFHNDSTPRYDEKAAELAWSRTLAFFNKHLQSSSSL